MGTLCVLCIALLVRICHQKEGSFVCIRFMAIKQKKLREQGVNITNKLNGRVFGLYLAQGSFLEGDKYSH